MMQRFDRIKRPVTQQAPVRVLIVDDSAFMRHMITRELTSDARITIVGAARNGVEAITMARETQPDVITLDIEMPQMDGLQALPRLLEACPARVIMLSSNEGIGRANTVRALELGAVDFILKPGGSISPNLGSVREMLLRAVHNAADARVRRPVATAIVAAPIAPHPAPPAAIRRGTARRVVIIGSSTGGPQALTNVIPLLPADLDAGVVVVQHMPAGFTASLAARLNDLSPLAVREAAAGEAVSYGEVLIAPGDFHLRLLGDGGSWHVKLDQGPRVHGVRPAVDVALHSAAEAVAASCSELSASCVILTGMGHDGTAGAATIGEAGGWVLAQDEPTCVIYGMPRSVIEAGVVTEIVPLPDMAARIVAHLAASNHRRTA